MNNNTNKLIPEFRFPEFKDDGEWKERVLDTLGKTISGLSGKSGDDFGEGKPFVTYKQVFDKAYIDFTQCGKVKISDSENQNELQRGDILFTTSSETPNEVGYASVIINSLAEPTYLNSFCFSFRPENLDNLLPDFSRYLFHSPIYRKSISVLAQGSTRFNISKGSFLNLRLPLPSPTEQQKIADCLSSLDDLITAHTDKLEILKTYKRGLMQNFFPQEGEKVPKLRFKEFESNGDWESKNIENYIELFSGIALKSDEISDNQSGTPILRGINITEGHIRHSKDIDKFYLGDLENLKKYLIKENDIVIGMDGSKVGKNVALIKKEDENSILIQRVARIRTKKNANIKFLYQHFISDSFRNYVDRVNTSSGIPHISSQQIKDFKIGFPPKIAEQNKIAETLSTLDNLIKEQTDKIEQLKSHKKGLMQGLFPKITS